MSRVQTIDQVTRRGRFTPDEDAYILANADAMSTLAMARHLGRWQASVSHRLQRLRGSVETTIAVRKPTGTATYETVGVGDPVRVDRQLEQRNRRDAPPEHGVIYEAHPSFAVVEFRPGTNRAYREAFCYSALTVKGTMRRAG